MLDEADMNLRLVIQTIPKKESFRYVTVNDTVIHYTRTIWMK